MKLPPLPWQGGCQCGKVRYEITARPLTLYACHCTECQKQSSSAFGMSMRLPVDAVQLTGEPGAWQRDKGKASASEGLFCKNCGSRLVHQRPHNAMTLNIKAGTLDDTSWLQVVGHLWLASKQPWLQPDPELLNYHHQPENYDALVEAFSAAIEKDNAPK